MKRTLLMSVAAFALAAGTTVALSQSSGSGGAGGGAGGNTPSASPSTSSGGQDTTPGTKQKGAQDRTIPEKQKSTQQQPSPSGQGSTTKQSQDEKSSPSTTRQSQDNKSGQPSTTQQSQDKSGQPSSTQQSQQKSGQPSTTQQSQSPSTGGARQGTAERSGGAAGSNVSFTTEQKTKIRQTVLTSSAPRVSTVDFDVRVGTVVPRTVRVAPLPATIIEIEPQWRGYMYFVYHDEIIVVEPGSLRIVAVIDV